MPTSFIVTRVVSNEEKELEMDEQEDIILVEQQPAEPGPDDIILVRSKVAPVLLPVHKGLMPHHFAAVSPTPGAPPGLPPPTKKPLPFQSYLDVTLPQQYPFHPNDKRTKNVISSNALIFLVEHIWRVDPTALLCKWPSQANNTTPLAPIAAEATRNREFPNTVHLVSYYLHNARFHPSGVTGRAKIFLMHSLPADILLQRLNTLGSYHLAKCPIQSADVVSTVWLLGTTEHTNCKDLTTALLITPEFKARPEVGLVLRQKLIKLHHGERPSATDQVHAIHVYTGQTHYHWVKEALKKLYNHHSAKAALPPYGKFYAVDDATSFMATSTKTTSDNLQQQRRRQQRQVLRQCSCLQKDLVGLVPYGGNSLLKSQRLDVPVPSQLEDDVSQVLRVDRHAHYAFTYTFSWHQRYTPLAMAAIETILQQLQSAAAEEKDDEAVVSLGSQSQTTPPLIVPSNVLWHMSSSSSSAHKVVEED